MLRSASSPTNEPNASAAKIEGDDTSSTVHAVAVSVTQFAPRHAAHLHTNIISIDEVDEAGIVGYGTQFTIYRLLRSIFWGPRILLRGDPRGCYLK